MLKKLILIALTGLIITSCSSSLDTTNLTAEERLAYSIKLYENEDYQEAAKEFEALLLQFPGSAVSDDAQYYLGMTRFKRGEYIIAAYEFSKLIKGMPTSEFVPQSQFMLAECYYQLSPDYSLDQKYTKKAIEEFQVFIDFFPLDSKVAEAEKKIDELNDKLARKEYDTAVIYEKMEYTKAALEYYENVMEIYHDTKYAPLAHYNKINLLVSKNRNQEALDAANSFLKKYPNDSNYSSVEKIKTSLESKLSVRNKNES
ncbi:outer membrane protein assembly factor BamD [Ignavibacterium sp.]|uniref:outer membrane protein assembly factor BamD n=1 Tax=Ignavibacterium sp. TaxID=2651167 RepID=UPI00307F6736